MSNNSVFNATVCIIGIMILLIHTVNIVIKKNKRKDEVVLMDFFVFTIVHFATYLTFTLIKVNYTSNTFIIAFYTMFYIMNNIEALLLFRYAKSYISIEPKKKKALSIINNSAFALFVLLDIVNIFTGIFFTAKDGVYIRSETMILSQGYQFVMFATVFVVAVTNNKLIRREKEAFAIYCLLPFVAIILQNIFKGYAIAYASIIIAIEVMIMFLNVQKNIVIAEEEEKNKEAQIKMMLSQIQPHFIYNSLSSISTLIAINPEKAQASLDDFTEYLRCNISSLSEKKLIPFEDELKHIRSYVSLEKMRFGERINVQYDIQTTDFYVPPLSVQPIVENSIKHGILKRIEGGSLTLRAYQNESSYIVEVVDDGVGFNMEKVDMNDNIHIGLSNIKYRVENTCGGNVLIKSNPQKGTFVTIIFPNEVRV
ncbi:MAG: histidine kinase [Eubacterium sp.]|nr:histidine kinase [Eubacterium sp.]